MAFALSGSSFRSRAVARSRSIGWWKSDEVALETGVHVARAPRRHRTRRNRGAARVRDSKCRPRYGGAATRAASHLRIDRKSTRLNSSHDQISYAVFCLKKKKKS